MVSERLLSAFIIANPLIEAKRMEVVDLEDLKLHLTMRLAHREIDATSYALAMSALQKERA